MFFPGVERTLAASRGQNRNILVQGVLKILLDSKVKTIFQNLLLIASISMNESELGSTVYGCVHSYSIFLAHRFSLTLIEQCREKKGIWQYFVNTLYVVALNQLQLVRWEVSPPPAGRNQKTDNQIDRLRDIENYIIMYIDRQIKNKQGADI